MGIIDRIKDKYLVRLDELVQAGDAIPIQQTILQARSTIDTSTLRAGQNSWSGEHPA
jgi:hypothetical protein